MSSFHDFLVEHAKFPFPEPDVTKTVGSTDISVIEVGRLGKRWKAGHAVRDDTLAQKLCDVLQDILGDMVLPAEDENDLLPFFSPRLGVSHGMIMGDWMDNPNKSHVSIFFAAEQFELALTLRTESVAARHRILRRRYRVLGFVWAICLWKL
jgi:hypothetical protein